MLDGYSGTALRLYKLRMGPKESHTRNQVFGSVFLVPRFWFRTVFSGRLGDLK